MNFVRLTGAIYSKASAKTNYGIEQIFQATVSKIFPDNNSELPPPRKDSIKVQSNDSEQKIKKKKCC